MNTPGAGATSFSRAAMVCLASAATGGGMARLVIPDLQSASRTIAADELDALRFDQVLVWWCELMALGIGAWLSTLTVLVVIDTLRGREARRTGCPAWLQRLVWAACGVGVATLLASPAHAEGSERPAAAGGADPAPALIDGLAFPDRPLDHTPTQHATDGATLRPDDDAPSGSGATRIVQPGDTLWGVAASSLSPEASDADIADRWQQIFSDNAGVLGPDPDLIFPGTVLLLPDA